VDSPVSLENTEYKVGKGRRISPPTDRCGLQWIAEVNEYCPGVQIILIGESARS